jgi:YgiT-type zinc finger domain-containing protein
MTPRSDRCSVCGAALSVQTITYTQTVGENVFVVEHVPAQVCPQCGETYLSPDTADTLQEIGKQGAYKPKRTVEVPVFDFGPALSRS